MPINKNRRNDDILDLDPFDLNSINMFAARQRAAREATKNTSLMKSPNFSEFGLHYIGAMGEYAVSKYLGLELDYRILPDGDDGTDLESVLGSLQVKTFSFNSSKIDFFFNGLADFTAEIAVGIQVVNPTRLRFMGWITKEDFVDQCAFKNYGYGSRAMVPETKLTHIAVLRDRILTHRVSPELIHAD